MTTERAVLAGGCFWGVQELLRRYDGVLSTRVGYTGGNVPHATYRNHGSHAEAVEVIFDPARISYRQILEFFFQIHDPSTRNRQGNDVGTSYRSAIFYTSDEQRRIAEDTIADVDASGLWPGKVVTEVAPVSDFWEAEPEHQDYLQQYPDGYTCHFIRPNWRLPIRTDKIAKKAGARIIAGSAAANRTSSSGRGLKDRLHVAVGGCGCLLRSAAVLTCAQVGRVPVPPVVLSVRLLVLVVVLCRLAEQLRKGCDVRGACSRRLPLPAGKPHADLLEQPLVTVRILKRGERQVGTTLRVTPADAWVLHGFVR